MTVCCGGSKKDETDAEKRRNPIYSRGNVCCTDILVLLLFVTFWGFMVYIAVYSILRGDARRLIYGYDSFGNTCNQQINTPIENLSLSGMNTYGKPNVFFMSILDPLDSMQLCVEHCPNKKLSDKFEIMAYAKQYNMSLCQYDIRPDDYPKQIFGQTGPCPREPVHKSISILQRCVPDFLSMSNESENKTAASVIDIKSIKRKFIEVFELDDLFRRVLSDIYICWRELLVLCGVAVVIAFLMVVLMRFLASVIVWLIVILAIIGSLVGTGFLWWTYIQEYQQHKRETIYVPVLGIDVENERAFLIFSIIATILTVLLLLILFVMRKRISLVVALFHEAGKCLVAMPLLLIQPLWTFLILFAFFIYWIAIMAYIATMGTPSANYTKGFVAVQYTPEGLAKHFWWIHLIGLIWTSEFILACQQFVIAGAVALWYFSVDKKTVDCPIGKSICHLILHHIGSVAFGSLIITLVKIPRYILMYIQSKCEGSQNACAKCCLRCCICCLWCLEKILKFLNQNAYTIIAIDGINFCSAAIKAFGILTSNVLRVAAINSIGAFVLFLGKVGVMAATCSVAVVWIRSIPGVHYFAIPVFLISIFSFLIAHCFLSIYEMVVDALLLCFCEDCQMNDGSPGREYFMNPSLMEFVKNSSARIESLNRSHARSSPEGTELVEKQQSPPSA